MESLLPMAWTFTVTFCLPALVNLVGEMVRSDRLTFKSVTCFPPLL